MLGADKQQLEQDLRVSILELQWKELDFLRTNFENLSMSAAVLLGFMLTLLTGSSSYGTADSPGVWELASGNVTAWQASEAAVSGILGLSSIVSFACNLIVLFISSVVAMAGSSMALRGPEGSTIVAVRHMEEQNKRALRFFGRGLVTFNIAIGMVGVRFSYGLGYIKGFAIIVVSLLTFRVLQRFGFEIEEKFHLPSDRTTRGQFVPRDDGCFRWEGGAARAAPARSRLTPLWRLDKVLAFPYHDEERILAGMGLKPARGRGEASSERTASSFSAQRRAEDLGVHELILRAQGGGASADDADALPDPSSSAFFAEVYRSALHVTQSLFQLPARSPSHASDAPPAESVVAPLAVEEPPAPPPHADVRRLSTLDERVEGQRSSASWWSRRSSNHAERTREESVTEGRGSKRDSMRRSSVCRRSRRSSALRTPARDDSSGVAEEESETRAEDQAEERGSADGARPEVSDPEIVNEASPTPRS
ncbi:hypothetical protein AB1Y20_018616 [Prymnesium parvum]|uniref:Uncharacterized protein n=1 Tax=Prymnesium parvum TaxID=97485 RepID=A0AB34JP34_PRYPA